MNKKLIWGIVIVVLIVAGVWLNWASKQVIVRENTKTPTQVVTTPKQGIVIEQPTPNQEVKLPITVKGYINGNGWSAFEGVAGSVQVFDANGKAISERTPLQATEDWMQPIVHFKATVGDREMMSHLATPTGVLVFKSENEKDDSSEKEFRLPIKFKSITSVSNTGTIKGHVTLDCYTDSNTPPCTPLDLTTLGLIFHRTSTIDKSIKFNADGTYSVNLTPGSYYIDEDNNDWNNTGWTAEFSCYSAGYKPILVAANKTVECNVVISKIKKTYPI